MIRGPVALASCREGLELDTDMPLLVAALMRSGVECAAVPWDGDIDWSQYAVVVIRSTWDYHRRYEAFMTWVRSASQVTRLANSAEIVVWNTDKHYLAELGAAGIPTVPTTFADPGGYLDRNSVEQLLRAGDVVVKPAVSAGSNDTERHADFGTLRHHIAALHESGRTAMVQPYLREVEVSSETGLVFIDGEFSHAFAKGPMLRDPKIMAEGLYAEERIESRHPTPSELSLGERVMAFVAERFSSSLYARVDLLPGPDGPVVIELEMTEPSLYVHLDDAAADRLAAAIARRLA